MRRLGLLAILLTLLLVQGASAAGKVLIDDPQNLLGGKRGEVEAAARGLTDQGIDVILIAAKKYTASPENRLTPDTTEAESFINARLRR